MHAVSKLFEDLTQKQKGVGVGTETERGTHVRTHTRTHARKQARTHARTHARTGILAIHNLIYTQLKADSKQRLETDEDSSTEQKTREVYSFGQRNVSVILEHVQAAVVLERGSVRVGLCQRGGGRSFHVDETWLIFKGTSLGRD